MYAIDFLTDDDEKSWEISKSICRLLWGAEKQILYNKIYKKIQPLRTFSSYLRCGKVVLIINISCGLVTGEKIIQKQSLEKARHFGILTWQPHQGISFSHRKTIWSSVTVTCHAFFFFCSGFGRITSIIETPSLVTSTGGLLIRHMHRIDFFPLSEWVLWNDLLHRIHIYVSFSRSSSSTAYNRYV